MMDSIKSIEKRHDGNEFRFIVTLENASGATLPADVSAAEIQTFAAFQRAVLARYGVLYRDEQYERGRGVGKSNWHDEIEWQLARNGKRATNLTERAAT